MYQVSGGGHDPHQPLRARYGALRRPRRLRRVYVKVIRAGVIGLTHYYAAHLAKERRLHFVPVRSR